VDKHGDMAHLELTYNLTVDDKFLNPNVCNYLIDLFELYSKDWRDFRGRKLIPLEHHKDQSFKEICSDINNRLSKYGKIYDVEICKWEPGLDHDWHQDLGEHERTCICYLNDNYIGGETQICTYVQEPKKGLLVHFDGKLPHKVNKVVKGIRYVLIFWLNKSL